MRESVVSLIPVIKKILWDRPSRGRRSLTIGTWFFFSYALLQLDVCGDEEFSVLSEVDVMLGHQRKYFFYDSC